MNGRQRHADAVYVLTRDQLRELDRLATAEFGIPSIVLMENAARHAADIALDGLESIERPHVLIAAGPGNNGGDGFALARHLHNAGLRVSVAACVPARADSDAAVNLRIIERMGLAILPAEPDREGRAVAAAAEALGSRPDLVVDALFGTGLTRAISGGMAAAVEEVNRFGSIGVPVLALDTPSGLDVDTGRPLGPCVRASVTVTFAALKPGFLTLESQPFLGEVVVGDIGAPRELLERLGALLHGHPHDPQSVEDPGRARPTPARARRKGARPAQADGPEMPTA